LAAGLFVLLLHGLAIWAFTAEFRPKKSQPPPLVVRVLLLPRLTAPPRLPPPSLPRFATRPVIVPIVPQIAIAPPPRDIFPPTPTAQLSQPPGPPSPPPQAAQPPPDYLNRLVAHLNAYKNYPYDARIRHEQGTVRLHFRMDRSGHVLFYEVIGSSGSVSLDDEARAMIRRAQPLPSPPASFPGDALDLVVPLVFSLH
jgi:protein TonB